MRRGEISMEVIIIAAIALLVLVIISVLVIRQGTGVGQQTGCRGVGGVCQDGGCPDGMERSFAKTCTGNEKGMTCCLPVTDTAPEE